MNMEQFDKWIYTEYIKAIAEIQEVCPYTKKDIDYKTCVVVDGYIGEDVCSTIAFHPDAMKRDSFLYNLRNDFARMQMRPIFMSLNKKVINTINAIKN
jgi:hypothetical protein